jgi:hypothetical protein
MTLSQWQLFKVAELIFHHSFHKGPFNNLATFPPLNLNSSNHLNLPSSLALLEKKYTKYLSTLKFGPQTLRFSLNTKTPDGLIVPIVLPGFENPRRQQRGPPVRCLQQRLLHHLRRFQHVAHDVPRSHGVPRHWRNSRPHFHLR